MQVRENGLVNDFMIRGNGLEICDNDLLNCGDDLEIRENGLVIYGNRLCKSRFRITFRFFQDYGHVPSSLSSFVLELY